MNTLEIYSDKIIYSFSLSFSPIFPPFFLLSPYLQKDVRLLHKNNAALMVNNVCGMGNHSKTKCSALFWIEF